jgi:hypothetical protein
VLPPLLYILTLSYIEQNTSERYLKKIESIYTGDTSDLLEGRMALTNVMAANIDSFLETRRLVALGLQVIITVHTKSGLLLYPPLGEAVPYDFEKSDVLKIAQENLSTLNDGLILRVDVVLPHNTYLANIIVAVYIFITMGLLYCYYSFSTKRFLQDNLVVDRELGRLKRLESEYDEKYRSLEKVKSELSEELALVNRQLSKSSKNEDGMIDEIVTLEKKIEAEHAISLKQREEIDQLNETLEKLNSLKKSKKKKGHEFEFVSKRCKILYRNLVVTPRAVEGYLGFENEMKIKCEEVIMHLNYDASKVKIKRKVFGPKGSETVFEVVFGYKGRIYYRLLQTGKIEVVAMGTKNSQSRELDFLHQL